MADSRLVPCNLMQRVKIRDFPLDYKFFIYHLYVTTQEICGCEIFDSTRFEAHIAASRDEVWLILEELSRKKIVAIDRKTSEVFIRDWFRCHKFETPVMKKLLESSLKRVVSKKLIKIIYETMGRDLRLAKPTEENKVKASQQHSSSAQNEQALDRDRLDSAFIKEVEQMVMDEAEGRKRAIMRGEALPVRNWAQWRKALFNRGMLGEEILTDFGRAVIAERDAKNMYQKALQSKPEIDATALENGLRIIEKHTPSLAAAIRKIH